MAIRNVLLGGTDWIDGEILYADDLNDTEDASVNQIISSKSNIAENSMQIVVLSYENSVADIDRDYMVVDMFNDATGYNNTICTDDTTSTFNVGCYYNNLSSCTGLSYCDATFYCCCTNNSAGSGTTAYMCCIGECGLCSVEFVICCTGSVCNFGSNIGDSFISINSYDSIFLQAVNTGCNNLVAGTGDCIIINRSNKLEFEDSSVLTLTSSQCFVSGASSDTCYCCLYNIELKKVSDGVFNVYVDDVLTCTNISTCGFKSITCVCGIGIAAGGGGQYVKVCGVVSMLHTICAYTNENTDITTISYDFGKDINNIYLSYNGTVVSNDDLAIDVYKTSDDSVLLCEGTPKELNSLCAAEQCMYFKIKQKNTGLSCIKNYAILVSE